MLSKLVFARNTISSYLFFFFLIIDIYFLIATVIAHIFNPSAKLVIPIGMRIKEPKAEIEIHLVTAEGKTKKCSIKFKIVGTFLCFLLINLF